jgi:SAM-dependent methyltransferase
MSDSNAEFDGFSDSYEQLLEDPLRDRFSGGRGEFFHLRKRDLIRDYFRRRQVDTRNLWYLDLGCGKGELASMLIDDFDRVAVCDPSEGMLRAGNFAGKLDARVQQSPGRIPFENAQFDFVTAVCVFHHVPASARRALMGEMCRVAKPGGTIAIIEHNPYNPVTRLIVSRTPVDADGVLLSADEIRQLFREARLTLDELRYFLFVPERMYARFGGWEGRLARIPLGGQYAAFGRRLSTEP